MSNADYSVQEKHKFIIPDITNVFTLFGCGRNYSIPGYQRPYEWSENQIESLFTSILCNAESKQPLLLGTIQLNKKQNEYEIIDGQQRLTTLWLLLKALEATESISFSPANNVNEAYKKDLSQITEVNDSEQFANPVYLSNYMYICKLISDLNKGNQPDNSENFDLHALKEYILKDIILIELITDFGQEQSIERTIQIFDSLNTKGLPLDTKDIFKIKFYEYIRTPYGSDDSNLFEKLNCAYNSILDCDSLGSVYALSETDLLDVYRFFLIAHMRQKQIKMIRKSNHAFFDEIFTKDNEEIINYLSIDEFCSIAESMKQTQEVLSTLDKEMGNTMLKCAKELLWWSGYGSLHNLFYFFSYANMIKRNQIDNSVKEIIREDVIKALETTEDIWQVCSVMHSCTGRVVNRVYGYICDIMTSAVTGMNNSAVRSQIYTECSEKSSAFFDILNKQTAQNIRKHLFLALSYLDDNDSNNDHSVTTFEIKKQLFYRVKFDIDIEHIASFKFHSENDYVNSIGNLMYIGRNLNRSLGDHTKIEKSASGDFKFKLRKYDQKLKEYDGADKNADDRQDVFAGIRRFLSDYCSNNPTETIAEIISKRNVMKLEFFKKIYSSVFDYQSQ